MTARRAQGVKPAAGEVVAVKNAQRAVQLIGLFAVAADEAGGADAEATRRAALPASVIAAAPARRAACRCAQLRPPASRGNSISANAPPPQ
jgi:hypothetical protein